MLLAYVAFPINGGHTIALSIVPRQRDEHSGPFRIDLLFQSEAAVFWIGGEEAVMVQENPQERTKIICPVSPAKLFLTPNTPGEPGIVAQKVMIIDHGDGEYETNYTMQSQTKWQPWKPCRFD